MKLARIITVVLAFALPLTTAAYGADKEFDAEQIMQQLEEQLLLSSEKLSKLKPSIDAKSEELKKSFHEAVDKGFLQAEEMSRKLDEVSQETEAKVKELLTSEEYEKFKSQLKKIDKDAMVEAKERIVADLSNFMELSEEQAKELKPKLEKAVQDLGLMVDNLTKEGVKSWGEFKEKYELLQKDLKQELETILDGEQMKKLEEYNQQKIQKIKENLVEA